MFMDEHSSELFKQYLTPEEYEQFIYEFDEYLTNCPDNFWLMFKIMTLPIEDLEREASLIFSTQTTKALTRAIIQFREDNGVNEKMINTLMSDVSSNSFSLEKNPLDLENLKKSSTEEIWDFVKRNFDEHAVPILDIHKRPVIFFKGEKSDLEKMYRYTDYLAASGLIHLC